MRISCITTVALCLALVACSDGATGDATTGGDAATHADGGNTTAGDGGNSTAGDGGEGGDGGDTTAGDGGDTTGSTTSSALARPTLPRAPSGGLPAELRPPAN